MATADGPSRGRGDGKPRGGGGARGERRLSDFLLWECAYAELIFSRRMWPDFGAEDLLGAVREFRGRDRR